MTDLPHQTLTDQLHSMSTSLVALVAVADGQEDHLLGALLCEANDRVLARYRKLTDSP
ncbi:MAG: hypothetical protein ACRYFW_15955 [Janthinobacterium lividum]